jgi:hypothetical protein
MTTYKTASKQLLDNYACISTLEATEIALGESVTVSGLAAPFAGTFTVLALPQYKYIGVDGTTGELLYDENIAVPNQVLYECTGSDVEFVVDYSGTVTYTQVCSWVTAAQILTYLGIATATVTTQHLLHSARALLTSFVIADGKRSATLMRLQHRLAVMSHWQRSCTARRLLPPARWHKRFCII